MKKDAVKDSFVGRIVSLRSARAFGKNAHVPERTLRLLCAPRLTLHPQKRIFNGILGVVYAPLLAVALLLGGCGKDSKPPAPKVAVADVAPIATGATTTFGAAGFESLPHAPSNKAPASNSM